MDDTASSNQSTVFMRIARDPGIGNPLAFFDIVARSGMKNVVSTNNPPTIRMHDGIGNFVVPTPGAFIYILSSRDLPSDETERAIAIIGKLAMEDEWCSSEIVDRHARERERIASGYYDLKPLLTPALLKVRRYFREHPDASFSEAASATGVPEQEISDNSSLVR